ncbi:MAG: hypothetical protein LBH21_06410 [Gracilibacteraceae bacterium]|jgi:sodium-dependent dicarboxylate transporter 2/3/5|nr:hypothetical protein [Gracilibacteraceae bacterium]
MTTGAAATKVNVARYVNSAITVLLMIVIGQLPPFGQVSEVGMRILGVFIGMLYGWITVDILWPSLLGIVGLGLSGFFTVNSAMAGAWGNPNLLMTFSSAIFAAVFDACKVSDLIAAWCLSRKFIKGRAWVLAGMLALANGLIGIFANGIAGIFLLWTVILKIAKYCGLPKGDRFISFLLSIVVFTGISAGCSVPFRGGAIIFLGFANSGEAGAIVTPSYASFLLYMVFIYAVSFFLLIICTKLFIKMDVSRITMPDEIISELKQNKINFEQKVGVVVTALFFIMLFLPGILPADAPGVSWLSSLGLIGVSFLLLVGLSILQKPDGTPFIIVAECHKNIPWPVLWLFGATFPLADAMKAPETGIMATVNAGLVPLVSDMSLFTFMALCTLVLGVVTQFTHNMVLGAMFLPVLCPLAAQLGGNATVMFFLGYIILNCAYVTPAASMQAGFVHGHPDIATRDAYIFGILLLVLTYLVLMVIGIPLGNMVFK